MDYMLYGLVYRLYATLHLDFYIVSTVVWSCIDYCMDLYQLLYGFAGTVCNSAFGTVCSSVDGFRAALLAASAVVGAAAAAAICPVSTMSFGLYATLHLD